MNKSVSITQISICGLLTFLQILLSNKQALAEENTPDRKPHISEAMAKIIAINKLEKLLSSTKTSTKESQNDSQVFSPSVPENIDTNTSKFSIKATDLLPIVSQNHQLEQPPVLPENTNKYQNETSRLREKLKQNRNPARINYKKPPEVVPRQKVPPILTTFSLNNSTINHLTQEIVDQEITFGDDRSTNLRINALYPVSNKVIQSLSQDNIFTSDFRANYTQLRTVDRERQVSINQSIPQTMKGFETQQTFIGPCGIINNEAEETEQQCTYLPPLVVDRNSIEPQFFIPTQIEQMGKIGNPISPETLAIIKQPGWQNIGADGEFTGIDLYFPNIGTIPGNSQSTRTAISRREDIDTTYKLGYYRVRQIVKANAQKAVIGQTIKGIGAIVESDDFLLYPVLGAVAQMLPDVEPDLPGLPENANTNINKNLFNSANNVRTPLNSFVIYQGGVGEAEHRNNKPLTSKIKSTRIPSASFNSMWIGFSPVTQRSISQGFRYVSVGEEKQVTRAGGEGGIDSDIGFVVALNDNNNQNKIASVDLNNFYIQAYVSFLERDVNFVTSSKLNERTNYYPHLSFTGNITNYDSVLRYYAGVITSKNFKFYLGADYTRNWQNWLFNLGAIAYTNGDKDYFSKAEGSIRRKLKLNKNTNLGLFTEFSYAWERDQENFLDNPIDNFVSVGANLDIQQFSLRISQFLDILPHAVGNKLQGSLSARLGKNASITAYLSPQRNTNNYGVSARYNWFSRDFTSSLIFNWNRGIYDFGRDDFDNELTTQNNTFTLMFKTFFK
ncbi:MAG: hypothetical protein VKN72_20490 [Nostocales cyanobacterium 94392]|nr:hypothetical protein [Nostocales cyanobacterium 94392]